MVLQLLSALMPSPRHRVQRHTSFSFSEFLTLHLQMLANLFHSTTFMALGVKLSLLTAIKAKDLVCLIILIRAFTDAWGIGLEMYCMQLSHSILTPCAHEPHRHVCNLSPYDHLHCYYQLCVAHYKRNIHALHMRVSDEVYSAMLSLVMCEEHPDIQRTLNTICHGGPKAAGNHSQSQEQLIFTDIFTSMVERQT